MSSLRKLSAIYIAAASAYAIAIFLSHNPEQAKIANQMGAATLRVGGQVAIALNNNVVKPGWAIAQTQTAALSERLADAMKPAPVQMAALPKHVHRAPAKTIVAQSAKHVRAVKPVTRVAVIAKPAPQPEVLAPRQDTAPTLRPQIAEPKTEQLAGNAPSLKPQVDLEIAPQAPATTRTLRPTPPQAPQVLAPIAPSAAPQPSPGELARVSDHLRESLTREMVDNFDLFLFVSKADRGPWGQRMYVFQKQGNGNLAMLYNWPVSTGRERVEYNAAGLRLPSFTPAGYYELDPKRIYANYHSIQWDQAMPYSMFFNWVKGGSKTGLAIHGATGEDIGMLGTRASAGCVRLAPENARVLFSLIRAQYKGPVPKFDFDPKTGTMSNNGILLHDADGQLKFAQGYKVLVFIENFGGENVVAALF